MPRRVLSIVFVTFTSFLLALVGITFWALEWSDVALLESKAADGSPRTTRVWYVFDEEGKLLVEAGAGSSPWLDDARADPEIRFEIDGESKDYAALIRPNPDGHQDIRRRLREKYGARDVWIAWLFDTSTSFEVELRPFDGR